VAIITQAEARQRLPGLTGDDATVALLITYTDRVFAHYLGYQAATEGGNPTLESATFTRYLPGPGGRSLFLPFFPIISITSIEDDITEAFDGSSYLVSSSDYSTRRRGEVRLKQTATHGAWSSSELPVIKAVWAAGYSTTPDDLKELAIEYVGLLWQTKATPGITALTGVEGSATPTAAGIPPHIRERLMPYMLPVRVA